LVELLVPFRVKRILSYDPYVDESVMKSYGVGRTTLEDLLRSSDIVSLHVRYTGDNRNMIGEREFLLMKPGSIFINTSRGELVDEEALIRALRRGIPAFACIDTCCREPWEGKHPLAEFENVLLTPHIAGASRSTAEVGARVVAEAIAAYFRDKGPYS
jgi:phosphoglycerate dehydrogenase-like enzyme